MLPVITGFQIALTDLAGPLDDTSSMAGGAAYYHMRSAAAHMTGVTKETVGRRRGKTSLGRGSLRRDSLTACVYGEDVRRDGIGGDGRCEEK
jgi:hypothetical protein